MISDIVSNNSNTQTDFIGGKYYITGAQNFWSYWWEECERRRRERQYARVKPEPIPYYRPKPRPIDMRRRSGRGMIVRRTKPWNLRNKPRKMK